ncbi:anti-sigma factor antagonist [Staphylococcus simiae]|uniref:anti-sigma factor antagonist n=1 Tax=Staphylococcus simiae TaxID=308354 RepID=UPI001A96A6C4|nr:anti-sigma factor antagonist [Staphylococcus simiae]MBO1199682.1 anti-sigma factor antagonist [Staphylococcus simiae]MBO1202151.1 anti-sigma factor antagonist [Staphylococcus simiae]MBO1204405.1 anti-sigma factor antagonist [Staphylococcus simiae]MBO1211719.1 anti-sigma factor antagonist [Staphylococcus simiae]MBO1230594.1 anti-sigma factor antagonist [Staphylococcus simiae]
MNLNIETVTYDDYYEVKVGGELDVYTVPELEEVLTPMRQDGSRDIRVNLVNVTYMDSTGLGLFVGTLKALNQHDKELYILGVSDRIGRLFDITGLKDLMHVNEGTEVE